MAAEQSPANDEGSAIDGTGEQSPVPPRSLSVGDLPFEMYRLTAGTSQPATGVEDVDPWTAWAYQPRSVTALLIGAAVLVFWSGALQPSPPETGNPVGHVKGGVLAMIAVFLGYCLMQAPNTILIRPHPAVWRLMHGVAVVYLMFLTFLLFQTRDGARQFLRHLHPDLGVELEERSYGADCRIYTPENPTNKFKNVYDTIFDEFVLAHIFGWYAKAIMLRNNLSLWIISVGFEFMEVTFNHMLPNFNECWWDSLILDILVCNWLGIWAGMTTVSYFDGKKYEWVGLSRQPSFIKKLKRSMSQFTPATWDRDQWDMFSAPLRFLQVLLLIIGCLVVELNAFFLKFCLWIPPPNPLNLYRLIVWWLIANPAVREYNQFLQNREPIKKLGSFCWLALALMIVESLISIKFGNGLYPKPMPLWLRVFWGTAFGVTAVVLAVWSYRDYVRAQKLRAALKKVQ